MPRKTDSLNPADWLWIVRSDLDRIRLAVADEVSFVGARSKLAEDLEKLVKAELIRSGWRLEKTHDLDRLLDALKLRDPELATRAEPICDSLAEAYLLDRYPGYDLGDPDWPRFRNELTQVEAPLAAVEARIPPP